MLQNALCYDKLLYLNTKYSYNYEGELVIGIFLKNNYTFRWNHRFYILPNNSYICFVNHSVRSNEWNNEKINLIKKHKLF